MKLKEAKDSVAEHATDLIADCPHCGARSHIEGLWSDHHLFSNGDVEFYVIFRCKPCRKLLLRTLLFKQNPYSTSQNLDLQGWISSFPLQMPGEVGAQEKEHIPAEVLADYEEALLCQAVGASKASCAMFRRALQGALMKLGADPEAKLVAQINSLSTLPDDIKDWSHQIRILGNSGAHPSKDGLAEVDNDDVLDVQDFAAKFLLYTFVMPAKVKTSRERRRARSEGLESPTDGEE